ncbi:hypothetical protein [Pseudarthrobacter sp. NBSH8]|uniref:baeRF3 domain-containing protein n=1 Tax=Pseudarthrobacter sp. NBSH8 TaxID=2596911 RepID=UPI00186087C9|nr:hypothetical protein [Pseudarthrobacter sp. NBSH8]QNE14583.1 hypothetical protein FYJ92_09230 [Pseudarthrobacter sp. NBSH8]
MFAQTDLTRLIASKSSTAVSIFMPTHPTGKEVRQDPIRLKNLLADAQSRLTMAGLSEADAVTILEPATALSEDRDFWQHQSTGLALFIDENQTREYRVPLNFEELVVVGKKFHIRPLLPILAADGHFSVLTVTGDKATLFSASRYQLVEDRTVALPERTSVENDYENPVQASPPARPNVGTANIPNAQVYGDSPPDFRKTRLQEFVAEVAKATENILSASPQPLVLVADAEIGGHFQQSSDLGQFLAGVVEVNANALDTSGLHSLAYAKVQGRLDSGRVEALNNAAELLGRGEPTATSDIADIVRASHQGRISTLLLHDGEPIWGHYDREADKLEAGPDFESSGEDLLGVAAIETLQHGGDVHVVSSEELPTETEAVALLRY